MTGSPETRRDEFLREMYKAMWDNVNRHIGVIWHSVTVLIGAFAVLGLVEKEVLPIDLATALVVVISVWQMAHVYDASFWVNRNLVIIRNIECQFLGARDSKDIHYYFLRQRPNTMIEHFRVQLGLGIVSPVMILTYHAWKRGIPTSVKVTMEPFLLLPYVVLLAGIVCVCVLRSKHNKSYKTLLERSPGTSPAQESPPPSDSARG